jgi:VWFA-related protein
VAIASLAGVLAAGRDLAGQVPAAQTQGQLPTFRVTADAVRVEASVRARDRRPLTGLTATDFELSDNGVRQEIADITYGQMPIDVTIALDVSFSVTGTMLGQLRRAVAQLMIDLGKEDRLKLILFNSRVNRLVDFTRDASAVERALLAATAGGGTTVYDTISVALVSASNPDRRQLVVCFTDGADSSSTTGAEELIAVAQRTRATLALVMPPPAPSGPGTPMSLRDRLFYQLVSETGGSRVAVNQSSDLTSTFHGILTDFRSAYVIHFRPTGVERGGFHTLKVAVIRPGASVLARRGYFGG